MIHYRHTQFGWAIVVPMILIVGGLLAVMALVPRTDLSVALVAQVIAVLTVLFSTLTVTVDDTTVACRFGPGLVRRRIALSDVVAVATVRNRWWYGWGIRLTSHGWLWNASGLDAVELTFLSGRKFRIGTDDPEHLAGAIRERLGKS